MKPHWKRLKQMAINDPPVKVREERKKQE